MGRFAYLAPVLLLGSGLLFAADIQRCPDLDGDHQPDTLHVSGAHRDSLGYFYTLDFEMSSGVTRRSILVRSTNPNGVRVVPRDVDSDHDIDLVITSLVDLQPISVLLNDGGGAFTAAEVTAWNWIQPRNSSLDLPAPSCWLSGAMASGSTQAIAPVQRGSFSWDCPPSLFAIQDITSAHAGVARSRSSRAPPLP